jgi:hypothetical protein
LFKDWKATSQKYDRRNPPLHIMLFQGCYGSLNFWNFLIAILAKSSCLWFSKDNFKCFFSKYVKYLSYLRENYHIDTNITENYFSKKSYWMGGRAKLLYSLKPSQSESCMTVKTLISFQLWHTILLTVLTMCHKGKGFWTSFFAEFLFIFTRHSQFF